MKLSQLALSYGFAGRLMLGIAQVILLHDPDDPHAVDHHALAPKRSSDPAGTITELPADKNSSASSTSPDGGGGQLGITEEPLTSELASQLGLRRGMQGVVVTDVDPGGPAAEAGLQTDDVILEVNRESVKSAAELRAAVRNSGSRTALLLVNREGRSLFLAVQPR